MPRRPPSKRTPPPSPANAAEGAARVRQYVVKLFDRQNGEGVDWRIIGESLFLAAFDVLDRLPEEEKQALARRVYTSAYDRAAGNAAGETGAPAAQPGQDDPGNHAIPKSPGPWPPK